MHLKKKLRMDFHQLIENAKEAAILAGAAIVEIYESGDFSIEAKSDDSPLTKADKKANTVIENHLKKTNLPILSEEGKMVDYEIRNRWDYFWMVDPLDGTKEFIKRNGEFTVNIALIHKNTVVAGVVYSPILKWLYWSIPNSGAFKIDEKGMKTTIRCNNSIEKGITKVVASRSHNTEETAAYIKSLGETEIVSMGSSLKILLVAEGKADIYPRFAPTMEWDTAAAHGVAKEAGAEVFQKDEVTPLTYNKPNLLNPHFVVRSRK
jgi:3'(2'), 5'-bisphosphate nucleotidase